jgi:hypothetical protein
MPVADTIAEVPYLDWHPKGGKAASRRTKDSLFSKENKKGTRPTTCDFGQEVRKSV